MSRSVFDAMDIDVRPFLDNAGKRLPIDVTLPAAGEPDDQLRVVEEMHLEGEAFAQLSTLYISVRITAPIRQPCGKCLAPVKTTVEIDEEFEIPIPAGAETVDLHPDVIRLVLSAHDPNVVCRVDCRGLCPVCGADLNQEPGHNCSEDSEGKRTLGEFLTWPDES